MIASAPNQPPANPQPLPQAQWLDAARALGTAIQRADEITALSGLQAEINALNCPEEVKAGLLLNTGDWEGAHRLVQPLTSPLACYWHALVHRREGDHANSRYWLKRTATHPVHDRLATHAKQHAAYAPALHQGHWDALAFADAFANAAPNDWPYALAQYEERALLQSMLA